MSHGPNLQASKAEPNLTPLLDVVLQLIMFFMMCVNFVRIDQINEAVHLPVAQAAVPMDKSLTQVVFLNMDARGKLIVANENLSSMGKVKSYLLKRKEKAEREAGGKGGDNILVVLRADKGARYRDVFNLLQLCTDAGYHRWQLRVLKKA
jgi:biopolymer transport protein ExbD